MTEKNFDDNGQEANTNSQKRRRMFNQTNCYNPERSTYRNSRSSKFKERSEVNLEEFFQISEATNFVLDTQTKQSKDPCGSASNNTVGKIGDTSEYVVGPAHYNYNNHDSDHSHILHNPKQKENFAQFGSKYFENLSTDIEYVESSQNSQGNYHNYVSKTLKSIIPIRKLNFLDILDEKKIIFSDYENNSKKILILDLDETLIHADFELTFSEHDHVVTFEYEGYEMDVPIILRPGLFQFLQNVSEIFDVFVFTASKREYADAVLNYLDPHRQIFKKRFYRENCINIKNKIYIKDLRMFVNCKQENIVIVDNSLYSFANQLSNGVLINSFYNDKSDRELFSVFNYLQHYVSNSNDLRSMNEKIFNFNFILEEYANNPLL
jgi:Dullard-like phosphatase family protein